MEPKYTFNGVELNGEELENLGYRIADVTGKVGNKGILSTAIENNVCVVYPEKVGTDTLSWSEVIESPYTGSQITLKGSLKLTVKGENGRAVGDITISLPDGNEAKIIRCLASDVKSAAAEYALTLSMKDYDGVAYNDAPVTWSTSNKSVASVVADKNGTKLVIPKGAKSGTAQITVTAKTDRQAKASFYVKVADEDIRLVDTSLFLNSNSYEYGYLELYPNLDWAETVGCENPQMDITVVNADGSLDERFEIDPDQNPMSGYVGIRYSSDAAVKAGTIKAKLNIRLHGNGAEELNVTKDIKVINKPTFPKTAVKLLNGYNTFWNNEGAYAKVQLTTGQEITFDDITAAEDSAFTIENIEQPDEDDNTVWEVTLKSKAETPKTDNAILNVQYAGYKEAATAKVKVTVKKSVPSVGVYADYAAKTVFYPELSKQMTVLVQIPDGMSEEEAVNGLGLTKAAEKVFDIVNIEAGYGDTIINGRFVDLGRTLYVTLESKNEKSGNVQFTLTPANGSGTITTKSWKITAGKVSAEKTIMYDYMTGRTATTLTLQQALVGKERVELGTSISSGALYNGSDVEIDVTAADDFTKDMLDKGLLKVQKVNSYFYVWGTKGLFEQNKNACKLTFIHTIKNSETGETVPGPKAAVVTISLKKQSQAINATATVKADSALNVVDTENLVGLGMNLKNLPQGATVVYAELAEQADREKYALVSADDYWNEEKERVDSKADVSYWYDDYECGVYLTGKDGAQLPLGKTNVKLNLGIRLTDGSIVKIPATVSLNVVQNATVTAERKTLTLYNAVVGEEYAQWINLMMRIGREEKTECISAVEVSGLEGTGIAVKVNEEEPSDVQFYIESAAQTKSYKAKLTVHVAGAGTRNGKEVTYTVPVTITVKN